MVITFVAQYPSASDEFWVLVLVHFILGANLPDAAMEIRVFFNDGFLDEFLWEDVISLLILVRSLEVRVAPTHLDMAAGGFLDC